MTRDSPCPDDKSIVPPVRKDPSDAPRELPEEDQQALRSIVSSAEQTGTRAIRDLLEFGVDRLGVENGHLTSIRPGPGTHTFDAVVNPLSSIQEGNSQDLSATYCRRVVAEGGEFVG